MRFKAGVTGLPAVRSKLARLGRPLNRDEAETIGRMVVEAMKGLISKGISPVRGGEAKTKFPAYINPKKYPGKKKPRTPVNLHLKGDFLEALKYRVVERAFGWAVELGYFDSKQAVKEKGHREGANGQPHRPTIPIATNDERFAASVEQPYLKVILGAIRKRTE